MLDEEVCGADVVRTMISHVAEETQGLCRGAHEGHSALRQQQDLPSVTTQLYCLYPLNMPDPIRKRFGLGQLWLLRSACSQN